VLYGSHEKKQSCPECGQETAGTISEGGARWALCESCYRRIMESADPPGGYGFDKKTKTSSQEDVDGWE